MKLKRLFENLFEDLSEDVDEVAAYPEGFDINQLKALPSYSAKLKYVQQHNMDKLGVGSSRAVFAADPTTVIKLAKNSKGLEQNRLESEVSAFMGADAIVALVKESDANNLYVESERARKAKPSDFKRIHGFAMDDFFQALYKKAYIQKGGTQYMGQQTEQYDAIFESDFFSEVLELVGNFQMPMGDVRRISSWGVVNRNGKDHLVLVDYGLDEDIYRRMYQHR